MSRVTYAWVLLGVVLLLSPLWFGALHVGEPTYRYERVALNPDESSIHVPPEVHEIRGVGCVDVASPTISCVALSRTFQNGSDPVAAVHVLHRARYVRVEMDGWREPPLETRLHRVEVNDTDRGEVVRLTPVSVEQALADLSTPVSSPRLADTVRRTVRERSATTHEPLPDDSTGRVVEHDGQFYVIQRVAATGGWDPTARTIALTTLVVVGALSIVLRQE